MDEKLLEEIRRQEEALNAPTTEEEDGIDEVEENPVAELQDSESVTPIGDTKQTTLFGGDY